MTPNTAQLTTLVVFAVSLASCGEHAAEANTWLGRAAALVPLVKEVPELLSLNGADLKAEWAGASPADKAAIIQAAEKQLDLGDGALTAKADAVIEAGVAILASVSTALAAWKGTPKAAG